MNIVKIGSRVRVSFNSFRDEFTIVAHKHADPARKMLSAHSPVGRALLGRSLGDSVTVSTGFLEQEYEIVDICSPKPSSA